MSTITMPERPVTERAIETLKRAGNPFRNYFARNPDDEVCARYHVPELYASERELLLNVVDLYRYDPMTHSEIVPILGNKGAGKTHLLHSIKHGGEGAWQMLVTPGVYQKDSDFLEYLLYQIIDTLLGGGQQRGVRPLEWIGEHVVRRLLVSTLRDMPTEQRLDLFPPPGLARWARRLGLGHTQAQERCQWVIDQLSGASQFGRAAMPVAQALAEAGLTSDIALDMVCKYVEKTEAHNTAGLMRRAIYQGLARSYLLKDESVIATFLTYGFAELEFQVRPTRQDLVLALFKVLMEVFRALKTPVVVAFDQLEDLLLARRSDDAHKIAEAFFAGIVQVMHQIDGLCFLIFAERGLWNRFVPSLDGYIQDRLNNPVHVPRHGTIKALRLEAPPADLVQRVVEARLAPCLNQIADRDQLSEIYPFTPDQIQRIAGTEPTLRDMLQQFRHLFDHIVYGESDSRTLVPRESVKIALDEEFALASSKAQAPTMTVEEPEVTYSVKSVAIIESPETPSVPLASEVEVTDFRTAAPSVLTSTSMLELWAQEERSARRKLEPEGALTGATRELQGGLGAFLQSCLEHGVKVGPWRLQHVVPEYPFTEHPTYGVISIAHWACKDGQPWKVGIGLFLAKGAGKPRDLEVKLAIMDQEPAIIDHLILLRPEDDLTLTGKSKQMWQDTEKKGKHARLEPLDLDGFATLYSFPRWLASLTEAFPAGQPVPNLADLIQDHCEKLLEQVCMPVQG
ncbi:MAG: hypothetical protein K8T89_14855 [Planctomycetes bacterium]|nr:hypothetical protein [Planctomycetota bacterium]